LRIQMSTGEILENLSPFEFEVFYFRLKINHSSATGHDDHSVVFVLENGLERLSPRLNLFTSDQALWLAPSPLQVRALLYNLKSDKYVIDTLSVSRTTTWRWRQDGIDKFFAWRQLLSVSAVPCEPFKNPPLRDFSFWDRFKEPTSHD